MTARTFVVFAAIVTLCICNSGYAQSRRPNVVLILADDLGWADTGLYDVQPPLYQTPNIDGLAKRGMRFTNAYAATPLCSSSRCSLLTGLSPARTGMFTASGSDRDIVLDRQLNETAGARSRLLLPNSVTRLLPEYRTLPEALKEAGYATGHFGKWHLGWEPYNAANNGFDVDIPGGNSAGPPRGYMNWRTKTHKPSPPDQHVEDFTAEAAVAFMKEHRDRPFFVNYWTYSVHAPFEAKPELIDRYRTRAEELRSDRSPTYAAMLHTLDENVGRVVQAIDELNLTERTIVIFASDNGGAVHTIVDGVASTTNAPLRGGKRTLWEGGTRTPFVLIAPGRTKSGSTCDALIQGTDIYPTILELVGAKPEQGQIFDEISIVPALSGKSLEREAIFCYFPEGLRNVRRGPSENESKIPDATEPGISVRVGDLKLIRFFHGNDDRSHRHELYDLANDIGETKNLAEARPDDVAKLDARIEAYLRRTDALVPLPNPAFVPDGR